MTTLDHYDRAMRCCASDPARWRALNRAGAAIRDGATVYEPYRWRVLRWLPRKARRTVWRFVRGEYRHD